MSTHSGPHEEGGHETPAAAHTELNCPPAAAAVTAVEVDELLEALQAVRGGTVREAGNSIAGQEAITGVVDQIASSHKALARRVAERTSELATINARLMQSERC